MSDSNFDAYTMSVQVNSGVNRTIRFERPDRNHSSFTLITWHMHLCISSGAGTFVFVRIPDMMDFFKGKGAIDLRYWHEKLVAIEPGGAKCYVSEKFQKVISEWWQTHLEESDYTDAQKNEHSKRLQREVLDRCGDDYEAKQSAMQFEVNGKQVFPGIWEYDFQDYRHCFVWCCEAIRFGVNKFLESVPQVSEVQ